MLQTAPIQETIPIPAFRTDPEVFNRLSRLPALRPSTLKLLSISLERESAIAEYEGVFRSDPVLTTDLLILANSPIFGMRASVQNVRHAIALLGLEPLRSLAVAVALKGYMQTGPWSDAIQVAWRHSIATAVIAEMLGSVGDRPVPLLYTAGLVHDVGRLALFQVSAEKYGHVLCAEFGNIQEYLNLEKYLFGCAHDDAGAFLAASWGFPTAICDCIRFHHWDVAVHAGQLFELVGVACKLADCLGFPEVSCASQAEGPEAVAAILPARLRNCPSLRPEILRATVEKQLEILHDGGFGGAHVD